MGQYNAEIKVNPEVRKLLKVDRTTHWIKSEEIKLPWYVRITAQEDKIYLFAEHLENGGHLPALLVTRDSHILIDGRTRYSAFDIADSKANFKGCVPVVFCDEADKQTLILAAYQANASPMDSTPPSRDDIKHTIELLLRDKTPLKVVYEYFGLSISKGVLRRLVADVQSKLGKERLSRARQQVAAEKMTIPEAAEHFDVEEKTLRDEIRGKKEGKEEISCSTSKTKVNNGFKSFAQVLARNFVEVVKAFGEGVITAEELRDFLAYEREAIRKLAKAHEGRHARMEALINKG